MNGALPVTAHVSTTLLVIKYSWFATNFKSIAEPHAGAWAGGSQAPRKRLDSTAGATAKGRAASSVPVQVGRRAEHALAGPTSETSEGLILLAPTLRTFASRPHCEHALGNGPATCSAVRAVLSGVLRQAVAERPVLFHDLDNVDKHILWSNARVLAKQLRSEERRVGKECRL